MDLRTDPMITHFPAVLVLICISQLLYKQLTCN